MLSAYNEAWLCALRFMSDLNEGFQADSAQSIAWSLAIDHAFIDDAARQREGEEANSYRRWYRDPIAMELT